jgi:hypothetical protein
MVCVLLLQDLLHSCARGGGLIHVQALLVCVCFITAGDLAASS